MPIGYMPSALRDARRQVDETETPAIDITLTSAAGAFNKGAWVQLDAVTAEHIIGLVIGFDAGTTGRDYRVDIGVGAPAAEVVVIADLATESSAANPATTGPYRVEIEILAGERIAARCSDSLGANSLDITLTEEQRT